ncbi:helix-turn-helix domain-containing protein [Comamonas sp. JC664]|uniref:helix-turn-helix domain-containing protein n=1 Tax=Comamonas sp. JC664 TaxID=2801917 RepID=UPI00174CF569|nr:helix-turn-helix domain-containing protein [Comamonas sp. JC664]MBL0696775.1 helix-turn-helix domain-containing protein [Comamonas sp. JC664]GHH03248.1 hypothetical protein GCM10012319_72010 [Comamonas sp. KCTC 72670]
MKPFEQQTYYEILEVPVTAPLEEIRAAYARLMELYSPDSIAVYALVDEGQVDGLRARMAEALEILSDEELRAEYDKDLGLPARRLKEAVSAGGAVTGADAPAEKRLEPERVGVAASHGEDQTAPLATQVPDAGTNGRPEAVREEPVEGSEDTSGEREADGQGTVQPASAPMAVPSGKADFRASFFRGFSFAYVSSSLQDTRSLGSAVDVPAASMQPAVPERAPAAGASVPASAMAEGSASREPVQPAAPVAATTPAVADSSAAVQASGGVAAGATQPAPPVASSPTGEVAPASVAAAPAQPEVGASVAPPASASGAASTPPSQSPVGVAGGVAQDGATASAPVAVAPVQASDSTSGAEASVAPSAPAPAPAPAPVAAGGAASTDAVAPPATVQPAEPIAAAPVPEASRAAATVPESAAIVPVRPPSAADSQSEASRSTSRTGRPLGDAPQIAQDSAIATAEAALAQVSQVASRAREPRPRIPDIPSDAEFNGELLRQVREARGMTLQQVADRTRISRGHLENVEADRYSALPAAVYLRGILMNLARELGLDPLRVSKSYLALASEKSGKK